MLDFRQRRNIDPGLKIVVGFRIGRIGVSAQTHCRGLDAVEQRCCQGRRRLQFGCLKILHQNRGRCTQFGTNISKIGDGFRQLQIMVIDYDDDAGMWAAT